MCKYRTLFLYGLADPVQSVKVRPRSAIRESIGPGSGSDPAQFQRKVLRDQVVIVQNYDDVHFKF